VTREEDVMMEAVHPPAPAERAGDLLSALTSVAEESFFGFFTPLEADACDAAVAESVGEWLHVTVAFSGPFDGSLHAAMPVALGDELLAAFLGRAPDEPLDLGDVNDMAGEFANMVCGLWLSRRCSNAVFTLEGPVARRNAEHPAGWRHTQARAIGALNDHPVAIWLRVGADQPAEG
jgi:hypothetical protein